MRQAEPLCPFWSMDLDPKELCARQTDLTEGVDNAIHFNCMQALIVQSGNDYMVRCPAVTEDDCRFVRLFLGMFKPYVGKPLPKVEHAEPPVPAIRPEDITLVPVGPPAPPKPPEGPK